ncbi:MAG: glycosyltransferase family 39 protein [Candidatus Bathyarchaeia archaeon]|jgi:4-amino-4-deoxy-L-arabinose transferase-like glycosyltransferase
MNESSSGLRLIQLKAGVNKWRIAFLIFALSYGVLLVLNLSNMPMQWDEAVNLSGASFLKWGLYNKFVNSAFYPPLFDSIAMFFFHIFGVSLFSGRLVSVVFSVLSLWTVFELAYNMYGGKFALISAVLLGIMPGYFWISGVALLDIMLVFFFTLSLLFFFRWLNNHQNKMLVLSGLALGFGLLTKYQIIAAGVVMIVSLLVLGRHQLKRLFSKFTLLIITVAIVIIPWIIIAYDIYASKILSRWLYAIQIGNPGRLMYSGRFPLPIFYLVEMTWPYNSIHPISLLLNVVGLLGLVLFAWRRKKEDKFVFIWFACVFIFFTLIENKNWRYVLPLFPTLAISATAFILFVYSKAENTWKGHINVNKKHLVKFAAGLFIIFIAFAMAYSINDTYHWAANDDIRIDIQAATNYANNHDNSNQSIMILCPFNVFSQDMVNFYLWADGVNQIQTYQYPQLPVDAYTPYFNITEFISLCKQDNVKYIFTYEYGGTVPYFNTTLNLQQIYAQLYASGNFSKISPEQTFGSDPRRIFILNFTG